MTNRQKERLADIRQHSPKSAGIFERVWSMARPRRSDIIRANCRDCCCYDRASARRCKTETCPLWLVNPYRLGSNLASAGEDEP